MAAHERYPGVARRLDRTKTGDGSAGRRWSMSEAARAEAVCVSRCCVISLYIYISSVSCPTGTDAALGGERGHSLAHHRAVPGLLRARRLRGGARQLRGVSAVFGSKTPGTGRRTVTSINYCALSSRRRLGSSLTSTRVCMRWPRGPTLSFLGGPAEVQPFGPLRAFPAAELSAASWRPIRSAPWPPACTTLAGGPEGLCAPRRCALVALRSRSVERLLSGRKKNWGGWKSAKFDTVNIYESDLIDR